MTTTAAEHRVTFANVAEYCTAQVPVAAATDLAGSVRNTLTGQSFELASNIVICDGRQFVGILTIETLLSATAEQTMAELMEKDAPVFTPGGDQEIALWRAVQNAETALPVVDNNGVFLGLIPPHWLVAILLTEHEADVSLLGGFLHNTSKARSSSEEPAPLRFIHRLPWLLLGLAGAMLAADMIGWFESQLEMKMVLAFFIPGIVYMADAVGTQTETLVVRGLSVGVPLRKMIMRELLTGLAIGLALALIAGPLIWWRWSDADIALCVAVALFLTCSTAPVFAMGLPWLFDLKGIDPAFGSGPLATVLQDLLSILIYFLVAAAILG